VVLVDALLDFTIPDPAATELVNISALIKEDIARLKPQLSDLLLGCFDLLDLSEI
jgi:hypothetical protein